MFQRSLFRVSSKIALLNEQQDKVLMTVMPDGRFGIPGGHMERGETIDEALSRELYEELNLDIKECKAVRHDKTWVDEAGPDRVIVMYTGILHSDIDITPDNNEVIDVRWVSYDDIASSKVSSVTYSRYLLCLLKQK